MIQRIVILFKALGEPNRLKIVKLLSLQELCVCELEAILDISQPRVSQHLKVLRKAGIVRERKERQKSFYRLDDTIRAGKIDPFTEYMTRNISGLAELSPEHQRFTELESNEKVRECREGLEQSNQFKKERII